MNLAPSPVGEQLAAPPEVLKRQTEFKEQIVMKVPNARLACPFQVELEVSDHSHGVFDAATYLACHTGPLLDKLRDEACFARFFYRRWCAVLAQRSGNFARTFA